MRGRLLAACALATMLVLPAPAAARGYAELLTPSGRVVFSAHARSFDYPGDGSLLHVGWARGQPGALVLGDVSIYDGRVTADQVTVPYVGASTSVHGLYVDGQPIRPSPNTLVPLERGTYLVAEQAAVASQKTGRVALRLVLDDGSLGVPPGTQLLVGLSGSGSTPATQAPARAAGLAVLGLSGGPPAAWQLLAPPVSPLALTAGSPIGARAASLALQNLGVPYVWGGASPAGGFDCSGLVLYVYGQLGISLSHFSGAQWGEGTRVPVDELQPGDLVFFDMGSPGPGHVGIYIGNGQFVHAPHTGDVVKVSSLQSGEYAFRFVGAVRPYGG